MSQIDDFLNGTSAPQAPAGPSSQIDAFLNPPPKKRTLAAVANDTVIEMANAAAGGVSSAANFIRPGNAVSGWIDKNIVQAGEASQSDAVKAEKQRFQQDVANADGVMGELGAVGRYVVNNPGLAAAQAVGSFVGPGAAVKGGRTLASIAGLNAARGGLAGGAAAGAAMAGGDAAGTAYELSTKSGATDEQAVAAGRQASVIPAVIGGVGGVVGAERLVAGAKGFAGNAVSRALKTGAVEGAQEAVEEGVTQYEGQRAAMPYDPTIDPVKGVAAAAGMGAALGAATGGGVSLLTGGHQQQAPAPAPVNADDPSVGAPAAPAQPAAPAIDPNAGPLSKAASLAGDLGLAPQPEAPSAQEQRATLEAEISRLPEEQRREARLNLADRDNQSLPAGVRAMRDARLQELVGGAPGAPVELTPQDMERGRVVQSFDARSGEAPPTRLSIAPEQSQQPGDGIDFTAPAAPSPTVNADEARIAELALAADLQPGEPMALNRAHALRRAAAAEGITMSVIPHASGRGYDVAPTARLDPAARAATPQDEAAAQLPYDQSATGRLVASPGGDVRAETRPEAVARGNAATAQRQQVEAGRQRRTELGLSNITPVVPTNDSVSFGRSDPASPRVTFDNAPTGRMVAGADGVRQEGRAEVVNRANQPAPAPQTVVSTSGAPFASRQVAQQALQQQQLAGTHEVVPAGGDESLGFVLQESGRNQGAALSEQAQIATDSVAKRAPNWRTNAMQANRIARELGIDTKGKRLAQVVAEVDARDGQAPATPAPAPAPGPVRVGRDQTPLSEGGKPFKTRKAAGDAKKLQPMMRVVTVPGGYALAEKTPAQLAAEERAAKRLRTARTSPAGEPVPAHAFIAASGGLHMRHRNDLGVDGNPRIGNRRLFGGLNRGLSIEQATEMLVADGYLSEGASHNDAYALIKKSLSQPQYNADGIERIAQAESDAQFEDYMAAQEEMAQEDDGFDPFGLPPELTAEDLDAEGYTTADPALQAEVNALVAQAEAAGIDTYDVLDDIVRTYANATQDQYNAAAREALAAAIARSNQDGGGPAPAAAPAAPRSEPEQGLNRPEALTQKAQAATESVAQTVSTTVEMPPTRQQESSPFARFATGRYRIAIRDEGNGPYAEVVAIQRGSGVEIEMRMPGEALEHPAFSQLNARAQALFETPTASMFDAEPPALELAAQTPAEAAARQDAQEQATKAEAAAKRAEDAAAKAEEERKRIAQASVRAADSFELGQDPMDSLTGQGGLAFSFAGARAATADKHALVTAQDRLSAGEDAETVRQETGWFQGNDGKWRFEISDAGAQLAQQVYFAERGKWYPSRFLADARDHGSDTGGTGTLGDVLEHPALFAAYPALRDMPVTAKIRKDQESGAFDGRFITATAENEGRLLSVLLHEIQHGIQNIEGFATGGSIESARAMQADAQSNAFNQAQGAWYESRKRWPSAYKSLMDQRMLDGRLYDKYDIKTMDEDGHQRKAIVLAFELRKKISEADKALRSQAQLAYNDAVESELGGFGSDAFNEFNGLYSAVTKAFEGTAETATSVYKRLAGEVEARNTQARQGMTDAQRRATPPNQTADVADSEVIVVFNGKEMENAPAPANAEQSLADAKQRLGAPLDKIRADSNAHNVATQMLVDGLTEKWTRAPEIIVARNMQDPQVPQAVRDYDAELKSQGSDGEARGFIYKGKVYLLSDQLKGPEQIAEVLFHEVLGHYGLRGVFGDSLKPILQQMGTMRRKEVVAKAREYGLFDKDALGGLDKKAASDAQIWAAMSPKDRLSAAEEVLAEMAQTQPTIGFVQRAISAIRNWLRANVPGFKSLRLTDADIIQAYILPARGFVTRSKETGAQSLERAMMAFSRTPGDQTQTEAFKRWFKGSKVVDAQTGKPLVVYHGTAADIDAFDLAKSGSLTRARSADGAFWFSDSPELAGDYAALSKKKLGKNGARNVMPVFLKMENPKIVDMAGKSYHELAVDFGAMVQTARKGVRSGTDWVVPPHDGMILRNFSDTPSGRRLVATHYVAFRPEQIKSAIGNNGDFDPANPDIRFSRTTDAAKAVGDTLKSITVTNLKQQAGFKATDYRGLGLQVLGRRQLVDVYGDMLPEMRRYSDLMARMDADKNEAGSGADQLAQDWAKLPDERVLAELMHDSTLAQIDPSKEFVEGDNKTDWTKLQARYNALTPGAKDVYTRARDTYRQHMRDVRSAIKERIERTEISSERKAAMLKRMDDEFFGHIKGVYFPLARFGQYVVVVKDAEGKVANVSRAETMAEADATRRQLVTAFPFGKGFTVGKVLKAKDFVAERDSVGRGFMEQLYGVLDKQGMDTKQRAELENALGQLYLSSLPDLSWAKHGIHRKGTAGFSQDARRAFAQNVFHGASYLAKLRYGDRLQDELGEMQRRVDAGSTDSGFDSVKAQQVVDEMVKRHDAAMNPKTNAVSTALTSLGFIFHLGLSPASAMVNLTQTALVAYPVMGAKWGFAKASAALLKASGEAARGKNDITGSLTAEEKAAFDEAVRSGVVDVTMAHDLAGIAQGEDQNVSYKLRPVMRAASFLFHHAEKFNRQVTFVAAYRLAREAGAGDKAAYEQAVQATYDGHFDYSSNNRPRAMQGNVARVVLLFKQYGQNMVYTLMRNAHQSLKGASSQERAQARKALGGLLAMHGLAAGALGLPMVTTLLAAASMLGGDDDEPWDAQVALQNMLADTFGQKPAEVMAHGLSRLTPWDISGRVGLDKLIFPDMQEGLEGQRLGESAMAAALGPVAGIGINVLKGLQDMGDGRYLRGLEAMAPSVLRGPLKSMRYYNEGVRDKSGVVVQDEVGVAELLGQASGFSPSSVRNSFEGKSAVVQHDRALMARRSALVEQFAMAAMAGDEEGKAEAREAVAKFNEKNPNRRIQPMQLAQSVNMRQKRIREAQEGVYLPGKRRDAMEAGRFAVPD